MDFGPEYFAADRQFVSASAMAFLKGKMGSADGKWKREREKTSTSVSPEGREGRKACLEEGGVMREKHSSISTPLRSPDDRGKKMASSAVPCVSTSNCEMARKQESPKEINRPRPDYLWLVGIRGHT